MFLFFDALSRFLSRFHLLSIGLSIFLANILIFFSSPLGFLAAFIILVYDFSKKLQKNINFFFVSHNNLLNRKLCCGRLRGIVIVLVGIVTASVTSASTNQHINMSLCGRCQMSDNK